MDEGQSNGKVSHPYCPKGGAKMNWETHMMQANNAPGLGFEPILEVLGDPVAIFD